MTPGVVAAFLVGESEPPSADLLRKWRLAGHAYTVLPAEHPVRAALRADYLGALARHAALKAEVLPLLRAWHAAGIEALVFKGFALAEWVYPVPGGRFHGDVDVLLSPKDIPRATEIAREAGWLEATNSARAGRPYAHGACTLICPGGGGVTEIDVHRYVLHSMTPWVRVPRRITEAVWARSRERHWEGVVVREPDPVDALLILMLQRCWGGDRWRLKPHDVLDVRVLQTRAGVSHEMLLTRARELGCERTLALFLERCDPEAGRLDLAVPSGARLRRWRIAVAREGGITMLAAKPLGRVVRSPRVLVDTLRALPVVWRVRRALDTHRDMRSLLTHLDSRMPESEERLAGGPVPTERVWRGVRWAMALLPRGPHGACVVRSLALLVVLRRSGHPAIFVSGVRRESGEITGHAWVELHGRVLPELEEPINRHLFQVNFTFPATPERGGR
jgi:hypothetical protein